MYLSEEAARCLLCHQASCTAACPKKCSPDRFIRSIRFENHQTALSHLADCVECGACEKACIHYDQPIRLREMKHLAQKVYSFSPTPKADLSTEMCGVKCQNPFFLSSSVVASSYDMCKKALQAGWAGVVYKTYSCFVPEESSPRFDANGKEGTPFIGFRNMEQISDHTLEENLTALAKLKEEFPDKVIVGSIMGRTEEEWTYLAKRSEEAGCDVIECNFSCPHMSGSGLGADVGTHPNLVSAYTAAVKRGTSLPVLAKMTPNVTNMELPALAAVEAGADGIAAINTIKSITDIDVDTLVAQPSVGGKTTVSGYSGKAVKPIAQRFCYDLKSDYALSSYPLSGIGGIETWKDALGFLLLGCENIQITTAVMQYGYRIIDDLIDGLSAYMESNHIKKVSDLIGKGIAHVVTADKIERKSISYPKIDEEKCVGCGRCYLSCYDGGHQAIVFTSSGKTPFIDLNKCVGCHLCLLVCPTSSISPLPRKS